jgi:mercuric ion binding protein
MNNKTPFSGYLAMLAIIVFIGADEAAAREKLIVRVDGLSCAFCAYTLEKKLQNLEAVESVEINLTEGTASLLLKEGGQLADETINQAVDESGFTPRSIRRISIE